MHHRIRFGCRKRHFYGIDFAKYQFQNHAENAVSPFQFLNKISIIFWNISRFDFGNKWSILSLKAFTKTSKFLSLKHPKLNSMPEIMTFTENFAWLFHKLPTNEHFRENLKNCEKSEKWTFFSKTCMELKIFWKNAFFRTFAHK